MKAHSISNWHESRLKIAIFVFCFAFFDLPASFWATECPIQREKTMEGAETKRTWTAQNRIGEIGLNRLKHTFVQPGVFVSHWNRLEYWKMKKWNDLTFVRQRRSCRQCSGQQEFEKWKDTFAGSKLKPLFLWNKKASINHKNKVYLFWTDLRMTHNFPGREMLLDSSWRTFSNTAQLIYLSIWQWKSHSLELSARWFYCHCFLFSTLI